jgi:hypothetical protein
MALLTGLLVGLNGEFNLFLYLENSLAFARLFFLLYNISKGVFIRESPYHTNDESSHLQGQF